MQYGGNEGWPRKGELLPGDRHRNIETKNNLFSLRPFHPRVAKSLWPSRESHIRTPDSCAESRLGIMGVQYCLSLLWRRRKEMQGTISLYKLISFINDAWSVSGFAAVTRRRVPDLSLKQGITTNFSSGSRIGRDDGRHGTPFLRDCKNTS